MFIFSSLCLSVHGRVYKYSRSPLTPIHPRTVECICKALGMRYICHSFYIFVPFFFPRSNLFYPSRVRYDKLAATTRCLRSASSEHRHAMRTQNTLIMCTRCICYAPSSRAPSPFALCRCVACHRYGSGCKNRTASGNIYGNAQGAPSGRVVVVYFLQRDRP